jgi:hypothetical protein
MTRHVTRAVSAPQGGVEKQTAGIPLGNPAAVCPSREGQTAAYFFSLLAITSPRRAFEPSA